MPPACHRHVTRTISITPLDLRSRLIRLRLRSFQGSFSLAFSPTHPFQFHEFPMAATASAPTPPSPNNSRFVASPSLLCGPRIFGKYLVDHLHSRPRPGLVPFPRPLAGSVSPAPAAAAATNLSLSLVHPRSALDTELPLDTLLSFRLIVVCGQASICIGPS